MKRLLIITQKLDEADDLLGFFVSWVREFSGNYERVTVITMASGVYDLPGNVRVLSLGKDLHVSKWRQGIRFIGYLWDEVRNHDAVFAHMSPMFAISAWPFAAIWHKRLVLWYLHRSRTLKLRLALAMVDMLVTADTNSLTVKSNKIIAVGHGIDTSRFAVPDRKPPEGRPLRILSVGRLSPIKNFETLIHAAAHLKEREVPCEVRIVGKTVMGGDRRYEEELHALVARLGVGDSVHFFGFVPYSNIIPQYRWADVVVGCTPPGGIDKVLLEGMAAGCVVMTSNTVLKNTIGSANTGRCTFEHGNWEELAEKLGALDSSEIALIGADMQRAVVRHHTLSRTIRSIIQFL